MEQVKVVTEEQLTKDELAQTKVGICPKCGDGLMLHGKLIGAPVDFAKYYHEESGKWELAEEDEVSYVYQGLQCQCCTTNYDENIVIPDDE